MPVTTCTYLQGDGDWETTKEVLGWVLNTTTGTLSLSPKRTAELLALLDIPPTQRRMSVKKLERLIGKLRSMHLAVPGAVAQLYHIQGALTAALHASRTTAYLKKGFHSDLSFWRKLCAEMDTRPTYLAEIVQRLPTDIGFTDASGLGGGGVWIDPNEDGVNYVWRLPWPADIRADLVSFENPRGRITNSDLELAALVLQEATFPFVSKDAAWRAPSTGSDNTPTVAWSFRESSTVNPVVADLLRIRSLVNRQFCLTPSVFYHPGQLNTMADDASRKFNLGLTEFLSTFSSSYSPLQSLGTWRPCHPPPEIVSCVISALRKNAFEVGMLPLKKLPSSTGTGWTSAPTCRSTTPWTTRTSQLSRSFRCLESGGVTETSLPRPLSGQTRLLRRGALSPRSTFWKADPTPGNRLDPAAATWTSGSRACSGTGVIKTPQQRGKRPSL